MARNDEGRMARDECLKTDFFVLRTSDFPLPPVLFLSLKGTLKADGSFTERHESSLEVE